MTVVFAFGVEMVPLPATTVPPVGFAMALVDNAPTVKEAAKVAAAGAALRERGALPVRRTVLQGSTGFRVCITVHA
jgi:hypothetical protein